MRAWIATPLTVGIFERREGTINALFSPRLPEGWPGMKLKNVEAFGTVFDLSVTRAGDKLRLEVFGGGKFVRSHLIKSGDTRTVELGRVS